MAVVEMGKLNLVAMAYEKDVILNALQRTGAAEIKLHSQTENTTALKADCEELREELLKAEDALEKLSAKSAAYFKETKTKTDVLNEVEVSYSEFMSAKERSADMNSLIAQINETCEEEKKLNAELNRIRRTLSSAEIYSDIQYPLKIENTAHARFKLGTIPRSMKDNLSASLEELTLSACRYLLEDEENCLIMVVSHKTEVDKTEEALQSVNFVKCPFDDGRTGEELYNSLLSQRQQISDGLEENNKKWINLSEGLRGLKIHCEYLAFELEKAELNEKMRATQTTFLLEAYVPEESEEEVAKAISDVTQAAYFEFTQPAGDEVPPTLLKNNKVIKNFEAITNMYSPPSSKEFDPNTVMALFYSVFLGFIMADIGYGLLMILGGGFLWYKKRERMNMIGNLGGVFAVGGIFTVIWGFLFNSFFGFALLPFKVMPDLQGAEMSWSLAGIRVPALLIISMLIGVVQICVGYMCLAVQCWRRGKLWDGVFGGLVWAVFSVGVEFAIAGFVEEFNVPFFKISGGIIAGASLVIAILTAGRKEKLLGKFTKGFGAAYGVINYMSDILSYARLYGLMLAGAVIADIISTNSVALISSGNPAFGIIGVLIMVVGHIFNLAIGLLGAYIHDARLQYVEFYGRFYEGEGELFTPLGSKRKHVYLKN